MAKAGDEIKELQRRLALLERLDGVVVAAREGPALIAVAAVRDPFALIDACRAGPPALADLAAALRLRQSPQRVTAALVARVHRNLRALADPAARALMRDAPRLFRRHGELDAAWLAAREAQLARLTGALRPAPPPDDDPDPAARRVAALVAALHGPDAADALAAWLARSAALGARRRREARRRLSELLRRAAAPEPPEPAASGLAAALDAAARELAALARVPGRAAARRLDPLLRRILAWPAAPADHPLPPAADAWTDTPVPEDMSEWTAHPADPEPPPADAPVRKDRPERPPDPPHVPKDSPESSAPRPDPPVPARAAPVPNASSEPAPRTTAAPVPRTIPTSPSAPVPRASSTFPSAPVPRASSTSPSAPVPRASSTSPSAPVPQASSTSPSAPVPQASSTSPSAPVPKASSTSGPASAAAPRPAHPARPRPLQGAFAARVRARGEALVRGFGSTRGPAHLAALTRTLAAYALAFPPGDGPLPPLGPEAVEPAAQRLRAAVDGGLPAGLPLPRALWLLRLPVEPAERTAFTPWVAAGLEPALLERVVALGEQARLARLGGDVELARAYADWLVRLVPHYRALGIELALEPPHFARLHATHRSGLALLAHCLIVHHAPGERGAEAQLARLRATLGLFAARPRRAEALLADLSRAPAGLGRARLPGFAAWLADDPLLDRFCRLCELAGEPVALSHALRRDFDRQDRVASQAAHLAALADPTPAQRERLARLARADADADRGWTRRRLAERCDVLQARAFARRLDDVLRELLAEAIGVAPPALTPAWRDALRFYLGAAERNRGLLGHLLRLAAAHPGRPLARCLPAGAAWLARAAAHMDTDAWLAPRRRVVELAGQRHVLALEDDPLEVLRMGIPFDTCLSLDEGFNADSTVLNALDPNKRVLYLRDARGSVVARKLLAVSSAWGLLGFRLYVARGELRREVAAAVDALCRELAAACRLPLADAGLPEPVLPGFWYDDGAVPWSAPDDAPLAALAPLFTALGRPPPAALDEWSARRCRAALAALRGDVAAARAELARARSGQGSAPLADLLAAQLGPRALARAARTDEACARALLVQAARAGAPALLRAAAGLGRFPSLLSDVADAVTEHALASAEVARAFLAALPHTRRAAPHFDDHSLEHRSMYAGPSLARLPVGELLAACDELGRTWEWIVEHSPSCADCRTYGECGLQVAAEAAYARGPDPAAVIAALRGRAGRLAQRVALYLAARFSLAQRPCPLGHGLGATSLTRLLQRPTPCPEAVRALAELRRVRPDLADDPDLLAAWIRQSGPAVRPAGLPTASGSPIPALHEFVLHLEDPLAVLGPWLDTRDPPVTWRPSLPTLHLHRRLATPQRRRLARLAAAGEHRDAAREWLARLGDEAALARVDAQARVGFARAVAWQAALAARPVDAAPDPTALARGAAPPPGARDAVPHTVDLALLREAVRALDPTAAPLDPTAAPPAAPDPTAASPASPRAPDPLQHALDIFDRADLDREEWHDLLARLLPGDGPPAPALLPHLARVLAQPRLAGVDRRLVARMAARRELHPPLLARLRADCASYHARIHGTVSRLLAAPAPDPAARDELVAAFIAGAGEACAEIDTPMNADDDARLAACLPIWLDRCDPPAWLAVYRELRDLTQQSRFVDALVARRHARPAELAHLRELARAQWDPGPDDLAERAARGWLLAALADTCPEGQAPPT